MTVFKNSISKVHHVCVQASSQQANQPTKKKTVDATSAAGGSADTLEQRQKEARKWINDWRARWGAAPHMVLGLGPPGQGGGGVRGSKVVWVVLFC